MRFLIALLLLANPAFALDLNLEAYACKLTQQCAFGKGCSDTLTILQLSNTAPDTYALEISDSEEAFTQIGKREQLGDWNSYTFDDLPSFRTILVINKDGNASMTALGSFFDELVSLQLYGTCAAPE